MAALELGQWVMNLGRSFGPGTPADLLVQLFVYENLFSASGRLKTFVTISWSEGQVLNRLLIIIILIAMTMYMVLSS